MASETLMRRFLQHALPSRFQRIRYCGWASPNSRLKFQYVQMLVNFYLDWCWRMKREEVPGEIHKPPQRCPDCEVGVLQLTTITDGADRVIFRRPLAKHSLAFLDSG